MTLLIVSFLAGILTIAAPCILPLIPVIIGGSLSRDSKRPGLVRPLVITLSLAASIIAFTLLLKLSTVLLGIPTTLLQYLSGAIVVLFGLNMLLPSAWEHIAVALRLQPQAMKQVASSQKQKGLVGDMLLGAALGPVFSSCSPTYALIVATVLPQSLVVGLLYLCAYALGLALTLLMVVYLGREFVHKLGWLSRPGSLLMKTIGLLFIITGICIIMGLDKRAQSYILDQGWYAPVEHLEQSLMR